MNGSFALAVHALVYLHHKQTVLSSEALAENICTHPARVRQVMARLKKAGLVKTREGAEGGYLFDLDPRAVTLRAVAEAVGIRFVSAGWRPGSIDMDCMVASGMAPIMDAIYDELDTLCRQRLEQLTIDTIDRQIFGEPGSAKEGGSYMHENV